MKKLDSVYSTELKVIKSFNWGVHKMTFPLLLAVVLCAGVSVEAVVVTNYWDFEGADMATRMADKVGGVPGTAVGSPVIGTTYGSAYTGSGNSLSQTLGVYGNYVASGAAGDFDFGTGSFAISFWYYDDDTDGDEMQMRAFDCSNTAEGFHFSTDSSNMNLRVNDDAGGEVVSKLITPAGLLTSNQWIHIVINLDRVNELGSVYIDGTLDHTFDFTGLLSGDVYASQSLGIGVIDYGIDHTDVQQGALDDIAFYTGNLHAVEIDALADGVYSPDNLEWLAAHNPSHDDIADVPAGDVTLQWDAALDPANPAQVNPQVTAYYVYFGEDRASMSLVATIAAGQPTQHIQTVVGGALYFWQVEEAVSGAPTGDAGNSISPEWQFETASPPLPGSRLISHWKFDNDLTDSVMETVLGAPTYDAAAVDGTAGFGTGIDNGAIDFTGGFAYVEIPGSSNDFNFYPQGFTFNCWVKTPDASTTRTVAGKYIPTLTAVESGWHAGLNRYGEPSFYLAGVDEPQLTAYGSPVDDDQWHMVAYQYDDTEGLIRVFVDGLLKAEAPNASVVLTTSAPLLIGVPFVNANGTCYDPFAGLMDDVKIYNYAISPQEVGQLYIDFVPSATLLVAHPEFDVTGPASEPDGLVDMLDFTAFAYAWLDSGWAADAGDLSAYYLGYWPFDGNLDDVIGGNDAACVSPSYASGTIGSGAIEFDADLDTDTVTINLPTPASDWSLSWWEYSKPDLAGQWEAMLACGSSDGWEIFEINRYDSDSYVLGFGGDYYIYTDDEIVYERQQWHHHALTYDSSKETIDWYIDGVAVGTMTSIQFPGFNDSLYLSDVKNGNQPFNGVIDDLIFMDYALDKWQVAGIYKQATSTPVCVEYSVFDADKNCRVDILDLRKLASQWLDSGYMSGE